MNNTQACCIFIALALLGISNTVSALESTPTKTEHHHMQAYKPTTQADTHAFTAQLPNTPLINHHGLETSLEQLLDKNNDVVFAFFFTHCTAVCTTLTQTLKILQKQLPAQIHIAMISIDPEQDTPEVLQKYVDQHHIDDSNWQMLTGDRENIIALQKAFEAYRGNKMNHTTSLFVRQKNSTTIIEVKNNFATIPSLLKQHSQH